MAAQPIKQTVLSFVLAFVLVIGFVGIWYVDAYYEANGTIEIVYETDSAVDFVILDYVNEPTPYYDSLQTSQRARIGTTFDQWNRTSVYQGNNTWTQAVNETTGYTSNTAVVLFEIPNIENWVIDYIHLNMSKNTDTDIKLLINILHQDTKGVSDYTNDFETQLYLNEGVGSTIGTSYSTNISLSMAKALELQSRAAVSKQDCLFMTYTDKDGDGFEAFAWEYKITMYGTLNQSWSIVDQVNLVLILSIIGLWATIIFLRDDIDVGGFVQTITKRRNTK